MITPEAIAEARVQHFSDPRSSRKHLTETMCSHRLRIQGRSTRAANTDYSYAPLSALSINKLTYGTDVEVSSEAQEKCYLLILPSQGEVECHLNNRRYMASEKQAVVISPGQDWSLNIENKTNQRIICIEEQAIAKLAMRLLGKPLNHFIQFSPTMSLGESEQASWWRTLYHLETEIRRTGSIYHYKHAVEQMEQLLLSTLIQIQDNTLTASLNNTERGIAPSHVILAETFIRENAQRAIKAEDIISAAGVPRRTLYAGFKRFRDISPMEYLRQVRLAGARKELLSGKSINITATALSWGFNHLGRFSMDYKRRYEESPSETLRHRVINQ